jgi:Flp pilus assembly pilin Flp
MSGGTSARGIFGAAVRRFIRDERGTETLEWGLVCGAWCAG